MSQILLLKVTLDVLKVNLDVLVYTLFLLENFFIRKLASKSPKF